MSNTFETEALPHLDDLYRTAIRMLHNRGEAEDVVQEVYLQAWKSFARYEPGTNCRAWLYKILLHKLDHQRRRRQSRARWLEEGDEALAAAVAPAPAPAHDIADTEVLAALDRLAPRYREAVLLADVEEFSYKEVAAILGVPVGTVMSRLSRGRAQLRASLSDVARGYGLTAASAA